jgi:hypothetical protein
MQNRGNTALASKHATHGFVKDIDELRRCRYLDSATFGEMLMAERRANAWMLGKIVVAENFLFAFDKLVAVMRFRDHFCNRSNLL